MTFDPLVRPLARRLQANHMGWLGIGNTMRIAGLYNQAKFRRQDRYRRALYATQFDALLAANGGGLTRPVLRMQDGWALDTSQSLPHLERMLDEADEIIAERSGLRLSEPGQYRSYFQDVWTAGDAERYPAFLDFATSSDLLATVGHYLGCIPALSPALPHGIRVVESNAEFDDQPDAPHDSQLFHIDYYSLPNVYVLVLLRDTASENGPWTFLPRSISQEVSARLGYWTRRRGYRLSDDEVYSVVSPDRSIAFCGRRGDVLFIESSGCMHFGSRRSVKPRFQLMLGYTGACRTDFTELIGTLRHYPTSEGDSELRKLVLDRKRVQ